VDLVTNLLKTFEPEIETISLQPSDGGRFEVDVNGSLLYSKLQTGRHAEPGEVPSLVQKFLTQ
jgi:selenoprotein W-related protein